MQGIKCGQIFTKMYKEQWDQCEEMGQIKQTTRKCFLLVSFSHGRNIHAVRAAEVSALDPLKAEEGDVFEK